MQSAEWVRSQFRRFFRVLSLNPLGKGCPVMPLVPNRFLFRVTVPCVYVRDLPLKGEDLLDLPETCRVDSYAGMDDLRDSADVRMAWNEEGLALQVDVRGKEKPPVGDTARPRHSDGVTLWLDTRDARTSHRASQYCHQFHFLAAGGGPDKDLPALTQSKINRAMRDAVFAPGGSIAFRCVVRGSSYRIEAFLPAVALHGWDAEQNPRLGYFYAVHDQELGTQTSAAGMDLPYAEDPTLWSTLELARPAVREEAVR
jgi:hypothetical protein